MKFRGKEIKRGTFKKFRDYLNSKHPDYKHKNFQYHQETRLYGDYLYFQDRAMFDACLDEALGNHLNNRFLDFYNSINQ